MSHVSVFSNQTTLFSAKYLVMTQQKYAVSAKNLTSQRNELSQQKKLAEL